ncbi:monooxygenase [Coemansia guatemalensis]|uniref:Monooxygenase n=1 Tax=Coemansia guatemalensis TaxID=2761395 RepID=A0A9W8LV81_9FUNG|nr:monooxygenase [Coemansia guatemalensis]
MVLTKVGQQAPVMDTKDDATLRLVARRIGIVGAGPAGLAAAREFIEENLRARDRADSNSSTDYTDSPHCLPFTSITVFERSNDVGGVWNYTPEARCHYNLPQDNAAHAIRQNYDERSPTTGGFPTPLYDNLHTNLPKDVMQFSDLAFHEHLPDFPDRHAVHKYIHAYADSKVLIHKELPEFSLRLNTEVVDAAYNTEQNQWICQMRRLDMDAESNNETYAETFDALLVCTGRVSHPYIPDVSGLEQLSSELPGTRVIHSKEYRRASDFADKYVLIVGGASSGTDISRQLSYTARSVHMSVSDDRLVQKTDTSLTLSPELGAGCNPDNLPLRHPRIKAISAENKQVVFTDGTAIPIPDVIIYATGYLSVYPFIRNSIQPLFPASDTPQSLTDGHTVRDLYKYLLYIHNPLLSIFGVPSKVVPFPLFEYQAMFVAQVYQGNVRLPSLAKMESMWQEIIREKDPYVMGMKQVDYENELLAIVTSANSSATGDRSFRHSRLGRVSEQWIDRRKHTFELRKRYLGY